MSGRALLSAILLVLFVQPTFGQLPKKLEKCLPYPTLAREVREMQPAPPQVQVHVIRVEFDPNDGIPADIGNEISTELLTQVFKRDADSTYLNDLANEIAEVGVRGTLQNHGFFRAITEAKLIPLSEGADISVIASISATPGPQYWMGEMRIESTDGRSPLIIRAEALRNLIPIQRAEVFDVEKLRTGLHNITVAYAREGYVDMTPEPDFAIEDDCKIINVAIKIDQQVQYRVGSVEFLGANAVTREKLKESFLKPGDVFDQTRLEEFFKVNRAILPADTTTDDVQITRDGKTKTVAISFDLRTCPPN
jgi:outer membrane protein assembly factor BamA